MRACILVLFFTSSICGTLSQQNPSIPGDGMQEALLFSKIIETTIYEYMQYELPASALPEAQRILDEARRNLDACEAALQQPDQIWHYKVCSSAQLRNAMASLSDLKTHYNQASGGAKADSELAFSLCFIFLYYFK